MSFSNLTPYAALDVPYLDPRGNDVVIAIVKATYVVSARGEVSLADEQAPIRVADVMWNVEDPKSSVKLPTDVSNQKHGADVVVVGEAVSSKPASVLDVALKVRDRTVSLRVHGPRWFHRAPLGGVVIGEAARVERVPLMWEKSYGGMSADLMVVEERNPSGVGVAARDADLVDTPAPQIEDPSRPHRSSRDKHPPVGVGPIMTHWLPRRSYAGTYDEAWKSTRMPLMPLDYDRRYENFAPPALVFADGVHAGDLFSMVGMTTDSLFQFALPELGVVFRARHHASGRVVHRAVVDTVVIEPGRRRFEIAARRSFSVGRAKDVLLELAVDHVD